jgi:hypothetical protein
MKRLVILVVAVGLVLSFVGCHKDTAIPEKKTTPGRLKKPTG